MGRTKRKKTIDLGFNYRLLGKLFSSAIGDSVNNEIFCSSFKSCNKLVSLLSLEVLSVSLPANDNVSSDQPLRLRRSTRSQSSTNNPELSELDKSIFKVAIVTRNNWDAFRQRFVNSNDTAYSLDYYLGERFYQTIFFFFLHQYIKQTLEKDCMCHVLLIGETKSHEGSDIFKHAIIAAASFIPVEKCGSYLAYLAVSKKLYSHSVWHYGDKKPWRGRCIGSFMLAVVQHITQKVLGCNTIVAQINEWRIAEEVDDDVSWFYRKMLFYPVFPFDDYLEPFKKFLVSDASNLMPYRSSCDVAHWLRLTAGLRLPKTAASLKTMTTYELVLECIEAVSATFLMKEQRPVSISPCAKEFLAVAKFVTATGIGKHFHLDLAGQAGSKILSIQGSMDAMNNTQLRYHKIHFPVGYSFVEQYNDFFLMIYLKFFADPVLLKNESESPSASKLPLTEPIWIPSLTLTTDKIRSWFAAMAVKLTLLDDSHPYWTFGKNTGLVWSVLCHPWFQNLVADIFTFQDQPRKLGEKVGLVTRYQFTSHATASVFGLPFLIMKGEKLSKHMFLASYLHRLPEECWSVITRLAQMFLSTVYSWLVITPNYLGEQPLDFFLASLLLPTVPLVSVQFIEGFGTTKKKFFF